MITEFKLSPAQYEVFSRLENGYNVNFYGNRLIGKTYLGLFWLLLKSSQESNSNCMYFSYYQNKVTQAINDFTDLVKSSGIICKAIEFKSVLNYKPELTQYDYIVIDDILNNSRLPKYEDIIMDLIIRNKNHTQILFLSEDEYITKPLCISIKG